MALYLDLPIRPMQHFIGQSLWSTTPIIAHHQHLVGQTLGEEDGIFLVHECGVLKQGDESVGVTPRYCGAVGKVANSQIGVFLGYASRKGYTLLDGQLFVPTAWFAEDHADKRVATGMPASLTAQSKLEVVNRRPVVLSDRRQSRPA